MYSSSSSIITISPPPSSSSIIYNDNTIIDEQTTLQYNNDTKLTTTIKGIQVGTGVTVETNGQATFTGVTTFTHSQFDDYIRIGNPAVLGSNTGSQIGKGEGATRPASLTFNHGGSATLELGSVTAAAIIGTNSHGANNKPLRFMTGMDIGTLTGGSIQMEIKNNAVNIFNDLDVDGHTELDNVNITGFTTFATGTRFFHHTPLIEMQGNNTATISFCNATTGTTNTDGMLMGFSSNSQVGFINVNESSHGFVIKTGSSAESSERLRISGV